MKSLYATLYFSSIVIPGALQASGMCHLRGRALSLCQGESGSGSRNLCAQGSPTEPHCTRGALGCCHDLPKAVNISHFAPLPTAVSTQRGTANELGTGTISLQREEVAEGGMWACHSRTHFHACQWATEAVSSHRDLRRKFLL